MILSCCFTKSCVELDFHATNGDFPGVVSTEVVALYNNSDSNDEKFQVSLLQGKIFRDCHLRSLVF